MKEKTLTEVMIELGMFKSAGTANTLDRHNVQPCVLDGKEENPQNEEKSRE